MNYRNIWAGDYQYALGTKFKYLGRGRDKCYMITTEHPYYMNRFMDEIDLYKTKKEINELWTKLF
jgi:hypothetical protein